MYHATTMLTVPQAAQPEMLPLPKGWEKTFWGELMPNVPAWIRESRAGH